MTKTETLRQFKLSLVDAAEDDDGRPLVTVTNHFITIEDHPCYGTRTTAVERYNSNGITFRNEGAEGPQPTTAWPKAGDVRLEGDSLVLWGFPNDGDRFLTITPVATGPTLEQAAREALDYLNEATSADFARGTDHNVRWALEEALGLPGDERVTLEYWDAETLEDATSGIVFPPRLEVVR